MGRFALLCSCICLCLLATAPAWARTGEPVTAQVTAPVSGASGASLPAALAALAGDEPDQRIAAVTQLAASGTPAASTILQALANETLFKSPDGRLWLASGSSGQGRAALAPDGPLQALPADSEPLPANNRLRNSVANALAALRLLAADGKTRLAAAQQLQAELLANPDALPAPLLVAALAQEKDPAIRAQLLQLQALLNLTSPDAAKRLAAVQTLADSTQATTAATLQKLLDKNPDGSFTEPDARVRSAASLSLRELAARRRTAEWLGNLFYGISLGSVLLLAALGLAITFGLMGIINMAHGELLMIGAYTTWGCQSLMRHFWPAAIDGYLLLALPAAFIVTGAIGMLLERTVIRHLYGRPLETLLATWGISLMLMQGVRTLFGAQNVEVANPAWMSGGMTLFGSLVLPYNRIVIICFSLLVLLAVWLLLNRTRLGLFVRAVTQNRRMADCVGVPTGRIDMLTFGLGAGIAGLGGVALSQLGNVGPDLGQSYIVDSFMVVVLGGVGQLLGTVIAAFGLGEVNKLLEPMAGAVLAKIFILGFIILFIQYRPQGLFAQKGRSVDA
jgi:urea transport system permease protein